MTYHAGIGLGMVAMGLAPRDPHVTCDGAGCSAMVSAVTASGGPPAWMIKRKAPPGWKLERTEEPFARKDYCPSCKAVARPSSSEGGER